MTEKSNKSISQALGIPPIPEEEKKLPVVMEVAVTPTEDAPEDDYQFARSNLRKLITKSNDIIDTISEIAEEGESPRAFEVLAGMVKNAIEANQTLLNLSKTKSEIIKNKVPTDTDSGEVTEQGGIRVQNAVFLGSTADLNNFIADQANRAKTHELANTHESRVERDITPRNSSTEPEN